MYNACGCSHSRNITTKPPSPTPFKADMKSKLQGTYFTCILTRWVLNRRWQVTTASFVCCRRERRQADGLLSAGVFTKRSPEQQRRWRTDRAYARVTRSFLAQPHHNRSHAHTAARGGTNTSPLARDPWPQAITEWPAETLNRAAECGEQLATVPHYSCTPRDCDIAQYHNYSILASMSHRRNILQ